MVQYKQKCYRCKNWVLITGRNQFPICYDCQKAELSGAIDDPKMKKLFDIPEDFYRNNSFLRSIKSGYLKFGKLSEKQIEYFKKTVDKLKGVKTDEDSKEVRTEPVSEMPVLPKPRDESEQPGPSDLRKTRRRTVKKS